MKPLIFLTLFFLAACSTSHFYEGTYKVASIKKLPRGQSYVKFEVAMPLGYVVAFCIIGSLICIAAHYCNQRCVGNFVKSWPTFNFGYITTTYNAPVDCVHKLIYVAKRNNEQLGRNLTKCGEVAKM